MDPSTNDFPYLTILLLHRAGLHQEVIQYCTRSNLEHVRIFGDEIYQKVVSLYGGRLPQEEMSNILAFEKQTAHQQFDVCRDALIHLLTGNRYC